MDSERFDHIARQFANRTGQPSSRRRLVRSMTVAMVLIGVSTFNGVTAKKNKVTVCHKGKLRTVNEAALDAHLRHGDTLAVPEGCGARLPCAPCGSGCSATYQSDRASITLVGEICDVRDLTTGEPGPTAICTCGCPDDFVHCVNDAIGADGMQILAASCCPGGDGLCTGGGSSDLPFFGAVCCKPELAFLPCLQQFRWAIGITKGVGCLGLDGEDSRQQVDCSSVATIEDCNELCRAVVS